MFHAELQGPMDEPVVKKLIETGNPTKYSTFLASRPRAAENEVRVPTTCLVLTGAGDSTCNSLNEGVQHPDACRPSLVIGCHRPCASGS